EWRKADLLVGSQGPTIREHWFDSVTGSERSGDIRMSYDGGRFHLTNDGSTLNPIPGTGLWRWDADQSPWGNDYFYVSKYEGEYGGKFLTYSAPGPHDTPG